MTELNFHLRFTAILKTSVLFYFKNTALNPRHFHYFFMSYIFYVLCFSTINTFENMFIVMVKLHLTYVRFYNIKKQWERLQNRNVISVNVCIAFRSVRLRRRLTKLSFYVLLRFGSAIFFFFCLLRNMHKSLVSVFYSVRVSSIKKYFLQKYHLM